MRILNRLAMAALLAAPVPLLAQETSTVTFEPGNFGTMVSGSVTGHDYMDYKLDANAGQKMFAELTAAGGDGNGTIYFNILPPGSDGAAIYNSSMAENTTTISLPDSGTYTIRVYQMGNDKDTGKTSQFNLDLSIQ